MNKSEILLLVFILIVLITGGFLIWWFAVHKKNNPFTPIKHPDTPKQKHCVIPPGPWWNNCYGGTINGSILSAQCTNNASPPMNVPSSIDLNTCGPGLITNNGGSLTCPKGDGICPLQSEFVCVGPEGSYKTRCKNITLNGSVLTATCPIDNSSDVKTTSIDLKNCGQGLAWGDGNGALVCAPGKGFC